MTGRHRPSRVSEHSDIPWALVVIVGVLSLTIVLTAMALSGGSEAIGTMASAGFLAVAWVLARRATKNPG